MVLESVVTDVLNKVLGDYVENLDRKQLKIGIWGGDVVLKNLKIRENALDDLNLPVRLIYGYLGTLVLKIPWKNLYSQPVIVNIEDLYVLISPNNNIKYDAELEAKYEFDAKQVALDALEAARKKELEDSTKKPDAGFAEKLTAQIVNNLQVKIANVHVRYEDSATTGTPISFGLSLSELQLYTTGPDWEKRYMSEQAAQVFKIANLSCLSAYMNCNSNLYSKREKDMLAEVFKANIARKDFKPANYNYVLGPISCDAKLKLNMNPEFSDPPFDMPKIDLCLEMQTLNVGLTNTQFHNIIKIGDSMNRQQLGMRYRKYRPHNIPYKNFYKEWWKFAITAVLEEDVRRQRREWSWEHIKQHRERCITYAEKYRERELSKNPPALLIEACTLLEHELDLFNLLLIRQRVNMEIAKLRDVAPPGKLGWISNWWSGGNKKNDNDDANIVKKFEAAMTGDEKAKLYKAIGYQENAHPHDMPETYEAIIMNFKLIALEIGLYNDVVQNDGPRASAVDYQELPSIMQLKFSMATCSVIQRPSADAISITAGMKELKLSGLSRGNVTPLLIESKVSDEFNLFDIFFETNPIDKQCDQRVKVVARPLHIIYDANTILKLIELFAPPSNVNLSRLEDAANARLMNFKERSATGMQYIIDQKSTLDANILLMPNCIVIPYGGWYEEGKNSLLVVSLGQVHVTSCPHHRSTYQPQIALDKKNALQNVMSNAYDRFKVEVDNIQILMARPLEPWQYVLKSAISTQMHILQPTSISVTAALCVVENDPRLPKVKVDIMIPSVHVNITEDRVFEAIGVVVSIPLPKSESPAPAPLHRSGSSISNFINKEIKKRSAPSKNAIVEETIQYTNIEVNFGLNEIGVVLYQNESLSENDSGSSTVYTTPVQEMAEVDTSELSLPKSIIASNAQVILSMQVLQIEAALAQRTFETVASLKIGGINIKQFDFLNNKEETLDIIDTPRFANDLKYLFTVSYTLADKLSPDFTTKYNSTEQLIVADFDVLNIVLHQECLLRLLELVNNAQQNLSSMLVKESTGDRYACAAADNDGLRSKLNVIMEETESMLGVKVNTNRDKPRGSHVVDSIKIRLVANLQQVGLTLISRRRDLVSMKVHKFVTNVTMKSSYSEINVGLKDITINDLNPHSIHQNILSIVGQDALNCQLVLYNKDETLDYNSDDMKITVDVGCIKIVFLNWFMLGVLDFLSHFQAAQEAVSNASAAAAESARQNALDAYQKATRMKLNVRIKAPIIVIPVDSQSTNALALDLGMLELSNTISELAVPGKDQRAVIDDIKLQLKDVKLTKVAILDGDESSQDSIDAAYGLVSKVNMMNPMSFTLGVTRNLSSAWYKELPELNISGRLKSIELTLFTNDYALIMSILQRNLSEGVNEFPPREIKSPATPVRAPTEKLGAQKNTVAADIRQTEDKIYETLKFNFQFDGVIINLMETEVEGLARFGIYLLSLKGTKLVDGTLSTSIVLCNIQLDDTRRNTSSKIRQYLGRKDWQPITEKNQIIDACHQERNFMVDLTAIIKENDTFAEVRVRAFDLIVCIDFLLKLTTFLVLPQSDEVQLGPKQVADAPKANKVLPSSPESNAEILEPVTKKVNFILHIDEPDIILVESLDDLNTSAIIFNAQAHLNYRAINDKQIINGQVDALKIFMCSFMPERREATRHYILHPCLISLQGSTPEEEGLHISLKCSDIILNVSPATIELLNKAMLTFSAGAAEKQAIEKVPPDYSNIWKPATVNNNAYWFTEVESATEALVYECKKPVGRQKTEKCVVEVPCITLVIESGLGYYTKPLISLDTRMTAVFNDWSRNLSAHGSLTLNVNYYNQYLAEWEPIIELIEHVNRSGKVEYLPWELSFKLGLEKVQSESDKVTEDMVTSIKIHSEENLEITMSKTCLKLLNELGEAFSQAIQEDGMTKPDVVSPYVVVNDTGFDITLDLTRGIFTLHEVHRGGVSKLNSSLVLHSNPEEQAVDPNDIQSCRISAGGRAYLQTKDLSKITNPEDEEHNLYVQVGDIQNKAVVLPVSKADTRYFPLMRSISQDAWAIVSNVKIEYGTTIINIHGVVSIENHFTTPINVCRRKAIDGSEIHIGRALPGEIFHVPLHAIYAEQKELYFSLTGYNTSIQGIAWHINPSDLNYSHQLQCDPKDKFEPLYINASRSRTEIYYEKSSKFKLMSATYTIHLRPPLCLHNSLPIDIMVSVAGCSVQEMATQTDTQLSLKVNSKYGKEEFLDYGEKRVHPGDMLHLPTVKISTKGSEISSFLVVRLLQYLEKDWSCTTEIRDSENDISIWTFSSYDSEVKMEMDLYVMTTHRDGSILLTLYSPFWMINKTGQMLTYKTDISTVEVLYHPPEYSGPILFAFRDKFFFDKKKAAIRIDNGEWSEKIPLDVAGSIGSVTCEANDQTYEIGVHNHLTQNSLTKQITFIPFYIARNKCPYDIEVQEQSRPGDPWKLLSSNQCEPIWPKNDSNHKLIVRVDGIITPAFDYTEAMCTLLKLENSKQGGINVDVHTTEGGVYITFTEYQVSDAPGLIMNTTSKDVIYYEKNTKIENILKPNESVLYTWCDPTGPKILMFGKNRQESDLKRDNTGEVTLQDGSSAYWVSFLDGLQRVLLFTEIDSIVESTQSSAAQQAVTQSIDLHIHGIGLSVINNETGLDILYLGIKNSGIIWEMKKLDKSRYKEMTIHETALIEAEYQRYLIDKAVNNVKQYKLDNKYVIDFDSMILKKTNLRMLRRSFYPGIWVSKKTLAHQIQLHVKINRIQIDNQFLDPIFPVVLAPIAPPKSVANTTTLKPFIECSIVQRVMPNTTVKQFKYARILIQEFHFKVDILFLTAIAEMFAKKDDVSQASALFRTDVQSISLPLSNFFEQLSQQQEKHYYDNLHLGPLKIHVSFSMAGSDTTALPGFLGPLVQGVGVTLTDVNDVVFRLAFFEREYQFFTQEQLISEVTSHYTGQGLKQLYVLVLGLDVLGNPYGLVVGLKKGVEDLFYEPFQGAIQGPGEFAEGLVLGVKSLFGHTVGGAAGAMSKITGAVGKGLAALTFDDEYQRKRRQGIQNKPKNFHEGIARSGKGLVMGFVDGVTGVVSKPVAGAREEGVEGFFKGLSKGAIGLVARPTAGVVDFASGSFEAVKRATEANEDAKRMRPPRFQHHDNVLRPYCQSEAVGNKILKELDKAKYATTDTFLHCEEIVQKSEYLLVTNHRVIYAQRNDMFGVWVSLWSYQWNELVSAVATSRGVQIKTKKDVKKVMGLLGSRENQNKLVLISDERKRNTIVELIESQRLESTSAD